MLTHCKSVYTISSRGVQEHFCAVATVDDSEIASVVPPNAVNYGMIAIAVTPNAVGPGTPPISTRLQLIAASTGMAIADPTCAVIDNTTNTVVNVIHADSAHPDAIIDGHTLFNQTDVMVGDTWDGTRILRRYVAVNATTGLVLAALTIPPSSLNNSTPLASQLLIQATQQHIVGVGPTVAWLAHPTAQVGDTVPIGEGSWANPGA